MNDPNFKLINELSSKLKSLRPLSKDEIKRLQNEFMIEHTYNSNAIEGNTLTLRETALIIQEGITIAEKPLKEHLEVVGYKDAFEFITAMASENEPLTERMIQQIHSLVLVDNADHRGVYRRIPVQIFGAAHTPPQPYLVPVQMEALILDYQQWVCNQHILEAIARFHLKFESIHPFVDGNGRTGRLIMNLELIKAGLLPVNVKFADRRKYYDCFDAYAIDNDIKPLMDLLAKYEAYELQRYIDMLQ